MVLEIICIVLLLLFLIIIKDYCVDYGSKNYGIVYGAFLFILDFCKKNIKIVSFAFCLSAFFFCVFLVLLLRPLPSLGVEFSETRHPVFYLDMSNDIFYIQTPGNCAPYSVMAVINILRGAKPDPERLARETGWKIYGNETFPQGLIALLHRHDIRTREYSLRVYTDDEKLLWLRNQVDNGTPVILLVRIGVTQHYFTVIGYDEHGFMIYDSAQERHEEEMRKTLVDREDYAGNRYYSDDELIPIWNNGGFALFFRNWAVVCYL